MEERLQARVSDWYKELADLFDEGEQKDIRAPPTTSEQRLNEEKVEDSVDANGDGDGEEDSDYEATEAAKQKRMADADDLECLMQDLPVTNPLAVRRWFCCAVSVPTPAVRVASLLCSTGRKLCGLARQGACHGAEGAFGTPCVWGRRPENCVGICAA